MGREERWLDIVHLEREAWELRTEKVNDDYKRKLGLFQKFMQGWYYPLDI